MIEEQPSRLPANGEVRLKVQAAGLNRAESLFMCGRYVEQRKSPSGIGYEASGVVDAVCPDVDKNWLGKRVAVVPAFPMNQYSMLGEEAIVLVHALGEFPAKLSAAEGAAVWIQYVTAYGALIDIARLTKGEFRGDYGGVEQRRDRSN